MIQIQPFWVLAVTLGGLFLILVLAFAAWLRRDRARHAAYEASLRQSAAALADLHASIDAQVGVRTAGLRRRADLYHRAVAVGKDLAGTKSEDELLGAVVGAIRRRFDVDHVAVFMPGDGSSQDTELVLTAVASREGAGAGDPVRGDRADPQSIVWTSYVAGELRTTHNGGSQVAVPVAVRGRGTLGVLEIHSDEPGAFSEEDFDAFTVVADQLALALVNARALAARQPEATRLGLPPGDRAWGIGPQPAMTSGYRFDGHDVSSVDGEGGPVGPIVAAQAAEGDLVVSIPVRGRVVGTIVLRRDRDAPAPSPWSEQDRALASTVGEQAGQAIERVCRQEIADRDALERKSIDDATQRIRSALGVDTIVQTAMRELQSLLGLDAVEVRIDPAAAEAREEAA